jgi:hypothetical protein
MCVCYVRWGSYSHFCECERKSLQPDSRLGVLRGSGVCAQYWPHSMQLYIQNSSQQVYVWWLYFPPVPVSTLLCLSWYTHIKPHSHDWYIWQAFFICGGFPHCENWVLVQILAPCLFLTNCQYLWHKSQESPVFFTYECMSVSWSLATCAQLGMQVCQKHQSQDCSLMCISLGDSELKTTVRKPIKWHDRET